MSLLNKNLKITNTNEYPIAWQKKIDLVQECMNEIVYKLEHENVNIHEKKTSFGNDTNINIIFRGDLKELARKSKTISTYIYSFAKALYQSNEIDYELKRILYDIVNKTLTPKLIEDDSYKIIDFNMRKYEKDYDYKKPTFWQKLLGKASKPNDYLDIFIKVDKK